LGFAWQADDDLNGPDQSGCLLRDLCPTDLERCQGDGRTALPGNLSMEDWQVMKEIIAAVRQAIPDAAGAPPGAVLEHVLGALRAAQGC
jgi:hypothetical protein